MAAAASSGWQEPAKHKSKRRKAVRQMLNGNDSIGFASAKQIMSIEAEQLRQATKRAMAMEDPSHQVSRLAPSLSFKVGNRTVSDLKPDVSLAVPPP